MTVLADPSALDGPLPGGIEGAAVIVEPMIAGTVKVPRAVIESGSGAGGFRPRGRGARQDGVVVPVAAFLIRHPGAGTILVDTGVHPSLASDPDQDGSRIHGFELSLARGHDVPAQLRAKGIDARKVGVVVMTHLHPDRASAISEFGGATFVVGAEEWSAATSGSRKHQKSYVPAQFDHGFDFRTVDFGGEAIVSYGAFSRTFDLFGDGSVRLAFTPGHSPGHITVIARLPRRDFVMLGDAAVTWSNLTGAVEPSRFDDAHHWQRSLREVQRYRERYPHAILVPGGDAELFAQLDERYED